MNNNFLKICAYLSMILWVIAIVGTAILYFSNSINLDYVDLVLQEADCDQANCEKKIDAVKIAVSLGRLDLITMILAIFGIFMGLSALFGFLHIRESSMNIAKITSHDVTEKMIGDEIKNLMPKINMQIDRMIRADKSEMSIDAKQKDEGDAGKYSSDLDDFNKPTNQL